LKYQLVFEIPIACIAFLKALVFEIPFCRLVFEILNKCFINFIVFFNFRRFSDVVIKTVFLLGSPDPPNADLQSQIKDEYDQFGDIVQGDFIDTYYNNTLKTMMGLRWAAEICPKSKFYAFFDDDYYVSTRNLLRFLRNPVNYPHYLEEDVISFDNDHGSPNQRKLKQLIDFELPDDVKLYAGKQSRTKKITDFGYPRACRIRKHQI
jgi:hypothetical protein